MNEPDDPAYELDRRPVRPHRFWDVIKTQDEIIAHAARTGVAIPDDVRTRIRYVESVLLFGGRSNPTINLPVRYRLEDVEAVIGSPEVIESGSDAAWRSVRKKHDAAKGGLSLFGGRTR